MITPSINIFAFLHQHTVDCHMDYHVGFQSEAKGLDNKDFEKTQNRYTILNSD